MRPSEEKDIEDIVEEDTQDEQDDPDTILEEADDIGTDEIAWQRRKEQSQPQQEPAEIEELARFREEWRAEVLRNRGGAPAPASKPERSTQPVQSVAPVVENNAQDTHIPRAHVPATPKSPVAAPTSVKPPSAREISLASLPPTIVKALDLYKQAVAHEQRGDIDGALQLYKRAFRLDDNVARVYERFEVQATWRVEAHPQASIPAPSTSQTRPRKHDIDSGVVDITRGMEKLGTEATKGPASYGVATGTLAHLVSSWPSDVSFEAEDEKEPVHLRTLPEELLVHILQFLSVTSLERFAAVNRKARILTLDPTIWRERVEATYKPPQISEEENISMLLPLHMEDYRRLYIEHPRIRVDGVYIAVCHYIRAGLGENAWVNVSHLITYHRYLRFYPTGDVLSLLTNEEVPPQKVIPVLKPELRMKGFFIGQWRLEGNTVYITDLMDPSGASMRYAFQMVLELRSRPLGRWNRLDFRAYDSVSLESGEATPLALKNDRPFWFSKVRSYA